MFTSAHNSGAVVYYNENKKGKMFVYKWRSTYAS